MISSNKDNIAFSLSYDALKLLGKGMYSNVWVALSELIANAIDAKANNVRIYIDMSKKEHSKIEIFDNGDGMSIDEIAKKYVVIGNNKRIGSANSHTLMGRKGVGKLAALFLSSKYSFLTKKENEDYSIWCFDFLDRQFPNPSLKRIENEEFVLIDKFEKFNKGTIIKLYDVNLTNMAEESINALSYIMSNYFIYEKLPDVSVEFFVKYNENDFIDFKKPIKMKKKIAFKNMVSIYGDNNFIDEISKLYSDIDVKYKLDYADNFDKKELIIRQTRYSFESIPQSNGVYNFDKNGEKQGINYSLKGWIGIHASINNSEAKKNDVDFVKNKYYNPNKLRLYIRNKLAVEDFTRYLNNTQQGINYIEGEISFDLLDDDLLDDITTSNRQDVDTHDPRVKLLIKIVNEIVNRLFAQKNNASTEISKENRMRKERIESEAKNKAEKAIKKDLISFGIVENKVNDIVSIIGNKFKGDDRLKAKEIYKIFISHSKRDRRFSDFIYNVLRKKGALEEDIFYTSEKIEDRKQLSKTIKDNITENNVKVLFMDSANFKRSEYCLFEGGAFWATKSVEQCSHLHLGACWIPEYINDSNKYHVPINEGRELSLSAFQLNKKKYNEIIEVLNELIDHLNESITHIDKKIEKFKEIGDIPSELELAESGKSIEEFMDVDFVKFWKYYAVDGSTDKAQNGECKSKELYQKEYNELVGKMN